MEPWKRRRPQRDTHLKCERGPFGWYWTTRPITLRNGPRWGSIASKIGCTPETLRGWVRQAERDQGLRPGPTSEERERIKALEREVRELRQANEILRKASAYFAQAELDRRFKP